MEMIDRNVPREPRLGGGVAGHNLKLISHARRAPLPTGRQARTMKIPPHPPFLRGVMISSLWQREVGRDFKVLFSN